jgi:hypothetical protein
MSYNVDSNRAHVRASSCARTRWLCPLLGAVALLATANTASAANICFPAPSEVPGLSGPPNWDQPGTKRIDFDEPRWAAAPLSPFANDLTGGLGSYRIMTNAEGDKLYVALRTSADGNQASAPDRVFFGFATSVAAAKGVIISMADGSAAGTFAVPQVTSFTNYWFNSGTSTFSPEPATQPDWLKSVAVFTNAPGGNVDWAVNFVVDLGAMGLFPDQSFKIAIGMLIRDESGEKAVHTPSDIRPAGANQPFQNFLASPADWVEATPPAFGCPGGITLDSSQITTTNADPVEINTAEGYVNVFQVRPALGILEPAPHMLRAELRIAGWPAVGDPQAGWSVLPGADSVVSGLQSDLGLIEFVCPRNTTTHVCGIPIPEQRDQALQVRLNHNAGFDQTSTRVAQASAYRSMRFGPPAEGGESSGGASAGGSASGEAGAPRGEGGAAGATVEEPGSSGNTGEAGGALGGSSTGGTASPSSGSGGRGGTPSVTVAIGSLETDLNCACRAGAGTPARSASSLVLMLACAALGLRRRRAAR